MTSRPSALDEALERYLGLLTTWNQRINLTAVREPSEIRRKHFEDSLTVVPHLPVEAQTLVDVGSGAGFPGAVLALACPALSVTLVESSHKKAAFLRTLVRELPLPRVRVESVRVEALREGPGFAPFDVAISRATFDLPDWLKIGLTLVHPSGTVIGMEGEELHPLPDGAIRIEVPVPGATRRLVVLSK
jgi:16S rRNA (guanine527-N7)-methyltransferase